MDSLASRSEFVLLRKLADENAYKSEYQKAFVFKISTLCVVSTLTRYGSCVGPLYSCETACVQGTKKRRISGSQVHAYRILSLVSPVPQYLEGSSAFASVVSKVAGK